MFLMGHRGARNEVAENTMAGFEHVAKLGLKAVELDIHCSKDQRLMVIHDPTLDRTTTGEGSVNKFTASELKKLDAGEGQAIPFLEEVFDFLLPKEIQIQVEIKDGDTLEPLSKMISSLPKSHQELLTVISFHHRWLRDFKQLSSEIETAALIYAYPLNPQEIAQAANAQGLSFNTQFIDHSLVAKCKEHNLKVTGWNANTQEEYLRLKPMGLDYLGTDNPTDCLSWD
jgi:glycerophosphoryl diester phosphodiesterase